MLGVEDRKGSLNVGADADLVIFSEERMAEGITQLVVDEVWKLGTQVYLREGAAVMGKKA
ncbi:N-acetyl-glucosamine-6-phosphate deacetylase [Fusarium falciforme]|uniref:N-acetyl-glucosamine-6-phosphate deacetylase n=2 Tax=Fusarium falciforme TaxID=195108 RepID=A0A9W8V3G8_9HYPO|nr:N-acetyl-glucosamine-6-phosphate deacetylase [Fusarium falciforme]